MRIYNAQGHRKFGDFTVNPDETIATIIANAISNEKLRDSAALSVIGREANSSGDPADIVASADKAVLHRDGTALDFSPVDHTYISDFDAAAQAAVGPIPPDLSALTFLTKDDETSDAPNSWRLVPGSNITFDDTTPGELVISSSGGGGGGGVSTVNAGTGISVNNTAPENPIINLSSGSIASLALADSAVQPGDLAAVAFTGDYDDLINAPAFAGPANPSASVGLTVVNGSADTFMRSDAAPPLDVSISPTWSGTHTFSNAPAVPDDSWSLAKLQDINTARFLGRITASSGDVEQMTGTQATTLLDIFTNTLKGLVPQSGGGTTNFLRADGSWAAPPGGSVPDPLRLSDGSAAAPTYSFNNDTDVGLYRIGANTLGVSAGGSEAARFSNGIFRVTTTAARNNGAAYATFWDPIGEKGFLGYAGSDDTFYVFNALNTPMLFATNNAVRMQVTAAGLVGIGGTPTFPLDVQTNANNANQRIALTNSSAGASALAIIQATNNANNVAQFGISSSAAAIPNEAFVAASASIYINAGGSGNPIQLRTGNVNRLVVLGDGRVYGTGLHNNANLPTGATNQYIASGTWTPTLTAIAGVGSLSAQVGQWMRIGNVVTASVQFTGTVNNQAVDVYISLPLSSSFSADGQLVGWAMGIGATDKIGRVIAESGGTRAHMSVTSSGTTGSHTFRVHFTYVIL